MTKKPAPGMPGYLNSVLATCKLEPREREAEDFKAEQFPEQPGAFHNAEIKPGVFVAGSLNSPLDYGKIPPMRTHGGKPLRWRDPDAPERSHRIGHDELANALNSGGPAGPDQQYEDYA